MIEQRAERWEGRTGAELAAAWGIPALHLFHSVGSTNDVARALAESGAPAGTAALAEEQLAGRGRGGKHWVSPPGLGIWLSVVLRPAALPAPGLLPLRVGLAAAAALDAFARPARVEVKWPNDLQVAGRKLGGILCEGSWDARGVGFVVAGIGINAAHAPGDFPGVLRPFATSLRIASGWSPPRHEVAGALVRALAGLPARFAELLSDAELAELERRDALRGRPVRVAAGGAPPLEGVALGVAPDGALRLRTAQGATVPVHSGTVRLLDPAGAPAAD
ncbi:MAG TPA: biotin--[acetyl-CoA-carboxylase] ligase [Longimicrobiaceae bacterium]|jgi:BirA family biotin operon repressor/biotin-[acetyl-CoA-carboxylase] ligase